MARRLSTPLTALLLTGACMPFGRATEPVPTPEVQVQTVDTVRVAVESPVVGQMEERIAVLRIRLAERDAQNRQLAEQLNATRQEVVRNMAKLRSQAGRAEAASGIAEAEIALHALAQLEGGADSPEYAEGQQLLSQSNIQFDEGNFGGALYLATDARRMAGTGRTRFAESGTREELEGEEPFRLPVHFATNARTNVRLGPGLDFDVQYLLEPETTVTGLSYLGEWVRVVDDEGRGGWIFHELLDSRR